MKKTAIFCALAAVLLLAMGSCKQEERHLLRYSMTDSTIQIQDATICEYVWQDGVLKQAILNNPYAKASEHPEYEDWCAFFNYTIDYAYENGELKSLTGNKYHAELTYDNGNLVRVDQISNTGVLAYRAVYSYSDSNKVNATYYKMSDEAIRWLESNLYPRKDSTGARVEMVMPEDTSLHVSSEAVYEWADGNMVYAKTTYAWGTIIESRIEYDEKINPFYNTYYGIDNLDSYSIVLAFGMNDKVNSKNNVTKVATKVWNEGQESEVREEVFEYSYEYDGDYPVVQRSNKNNAEYRFEY